jgi:hypothetical protein
VITKKYLSHAMGCVTALVAGGFTAAIVLMSPPCVAQGTSSVAPSAPQYVKGSLCEKPDQVVFSCPLKKSSKIVSICAAGDAGQHRFYYAFGRQNKVELTYPSVSDLEVKSMNATKISRSNNWSTVYSFSQQGNKYIVNSMQGLAFIGKLGEQGLRSPYRDGSLLVQKAGSDRAEWEMSCQENKIQANDSLTRESSSALKPDPDLKDGLPY